MAGVEQVENGSPSTSPPNTECDDDREMLIKKSEAHVCNHILKKINHMIISEKIIGRGSSSTVYKGEFSLRQVAIKEIAHKLDYPAFPPKEVFNLIKAGGHPNVVTFYGYEWDKENELLYIALELCTCTLKELIVGTDDIGFDRLMLWKDKKPSDLLINVIDGIVDGLTNLHRCGLIHTNLTPENILIKISKSTEGEWILCPKITHMKQIKDLAEEEGSGGSPDLCHYLNFLSVLNVLCTTDRNGRSLDQDFIDGEALTKKLDILALGNIITYIFTMGASDLFKVKNSAVNADLKLCFSSDAPEAYRLTKRLIALNPNERPTIGEVKNDLFLWSTQKKFDFVRCSFGWLKRCNETSEIRGSLENLMPMICQGKTWYDFLDDKFKKEVEKGVITKDRFKRLYKYEKVMDLLRFMCKKHHLMILNMSEVESGKHFFNWFPSLLVGVHEVMSKDSEMRRFFRGRKFF